mmetsp:Transcript_12316/g.11146  ORF Transcript_12316/g.11146 Transcript_12316/m.11146 type:complete len:188 (-) Transcript_12316:624-1187(-)
MNKRCNCPTSVYFPHRGKRCAIRNFLGINPYTEDENIEQNNNINVYDENIPIATAEFESDDSNNNQNIVISVEEARVLAEAVYPEAEQFRQEFCTAEPINELHQSTIPLKDQYANSRAVLAYQQSEVQTENRKCQCNISSFFPHDESSCEVISDRAMFALKSLALAFGGYAIATAANNASKSKRRER